MQIRDFITAKWVRVLILIIHFLALAGLVIDYNFALSATVKSNMVFLLLSVLTIGIVFNLFKHYYSRKELLRSVFVFDLLSLVFVGFCVYQQFIIGGTEHVTIWLRLAVTLKLIREFTESELKFSLLNPAQLFVISFLVLIFIGTLLLMLPKATYEGINFVDALFTSTSAVCVTGLIVVDTSSYFTAFGQYIILGLIQAGGLGILTFASYFSFFFKGGSSYGNQIALSSMTNSEKLGEVFTTVKRILWLTFSIELIGAIFIFINLDPAVFNSFYDKAYFSVFHSISAFCNAGFSTLPDSFMHTGYVSNYSLQFIIILIFVFGGLGFPIVINVLRYLKYMVRRYFLWFLKGEENYKPWVLNLSSKISLITTGILILVGTLLIYIKEYNHVLEQHKGVGKVIAALFTATTPRTAGFNSVDFSQMHLSSIMIVIFLMWIGAAPASTGGGIKTTTFAIATLNFLSLAREKLKIEVFQREIADVSVRRAFAVIVLSLLVLGMSIFAISYYDNHLALLDITFESFSAYSTVGLSLGITGDLSSESKLVLIATMFIGRVTMLTILIAFFKRVKQVNYSYPTDEILIN